MKKLLIYACSLTILSGAALAQDAEVKDEVIEEEIHEEEIEVLDQNVRLDFKLVPLDKDDTGVFIVTASSWYHSRARFGNDDGHIAFEVSGSIEVEDKDTLFLTVEAHVQLKGKGEYAEFSVDTSIRLKPDTQTAVAQMGDKVLVVKVTFPGEE